MYIKLQAKRTENKMTPATIESTLNINKFYSNGSKKCILAAYDLAEAHAKFDRAILNISLNTEGTADAIAEYDALIEKIQDEGEQVEKDLITEEIQSELARGTDLALIRYFYTEEQITIATQK
jgi:hypothetical protein